MPDLVAGVLPQSKANETPRGQRSAMHQKAKFHQVTPDMPNLVCQRVAFGVNLKRGQRSANTLAQDHVGRRRVAFEKW